VKVDFVGLRSFVVDDSFDTFDVQTSGCKVCGEKERDLTISEGFNT